MIFLKTIIRACLLLLLLLSGRSIAQQKNVSAPALSDSSSYTWIVLPDPQTYTKFGRNQALFDNMITWIADQQDKLKIKMVYCVGDLVEQNNIVVPDGINGDQSSYNQWQSISRSFYKLNNKLPYILCTGNHDYGIKSSENRYSQFNSYFPPQINPLNQHILVEMFENAEGVKTLENAIYEWTSPAKEKFLIFSLEFAPRMAVLKWASEVTARPTYKDHIGLVLTHSYLNSDGERTHLEKYPLKDSNYGKIIWEQVIKSSPQIQFVFSGHIANSDAHIDQVGYRLDKNVQGKAVNQMLFNAQREGGGWHGNGGDGWLRILEFIPNQRKVKVKTFSPLFFISPSSRDRSWRTESYDQFEMSY